MKIISLQAENVKRLRAVNITPDGSLVVISGENGAGKSSVLDAIEMALGGKSAIPEEPIHRGKRNARIVADLGEIIVERTFTVGGGSKLVVKDRDGATQKSPQQLLDSLVSSVSFDPLEFALMAPKDQDRVLRALVGIDFSDLEADRRTLYESRSAVNRDVKRLEAKLDGLPVVDRDVPDEEVSVADLLAEMQETEQAEERSRSLEASAEKYSQEASALVREASELQVKIDSWKRQIEETEAEIRKMFAEAAELAEKRNEIRSKLQEETPIRGGAISSIRERIASADHTNRLVRAKRERAAVKTELEQAQARARDLTEAIEGIDREKSESLEKAKYPIPGLSLDEGGVLLDGLPFEQACTSAKIRASIAIGAALNPKLRVLLVRRGNDLDATRMRDVAAMAEELGLQIWMERIESSGMPAVVIEDGEVLESNTTEAP